MVCHRSHLFCSKFIILPLFLSECLSPSILFPNPILSSTWSTLVRLFITFFCLIYQSFYIQNSILSFSVFLALQWISISYPVLVLLFCSTVHFYPLQINSEVCVFFVLNYLSWFSHFLCFCIGTWTHAGLDRNRETKCFTLWPFLWAVGV